MPREKVPADQGRQDNARRRPPGIRQHKCQRVNQSLPGHSLGHSCRRVPAAPPQATAPEPDRSPSWTDQGSRQRGRGANRRALHQRARQLLSTTHRPPGQSARPLRRHLFRDRRAMRVASSRACRLPLRARDCRRPRWHRWRARRIQATNPQPRCT